MGKTIVAADYDWRVRKEGMQFQVDHFYQPVLSADKRRIGLVMRHVAPRMGERILDIGCGVGTFAYHCARAGAAVVGMDYSYESLRMARDLCARFGVGHGAKFSAAHAMALPFKDALFDKVVAADFIEHTSAQEKEALLKQVRLVLKAGGLFIVFTPNKVREDIASRYWRLRSLVTRTPVPVAELHFGLIRRREFELMLRRHGYSFSCRYYDVTRPVLARIPLLRSVLALNLLWVVRVNREVL